MYENILMFCPEQIRTAPNKSLNITNFNNTQVFNLNIMLQTCPIVGMCDLADQCWALKRKIVGSSPVTANLLCPLIEPLYHNYSSQPRCINGYRQCWECNRLVVEVV